MQLLSVNESYLFPQLVVEIRSLESLHDFAGFIRLKRYLDRMTLEEKESSIV